MVAYLHPVIAFTRTLTHKNKTGPALIPRDRGYLYPVIAFADTGPLKLFGPVGSQDLFMPLIKERYDKTPPPKAPAIPIADEASAFEILEDVSIVQNPNGAEGDISSNIIYEQQHKTRAFSSEINI
jgi:hypothetical protein